MTWKSSQVKSSKLNLENLSGPEGRFTPADLGKLSTLRAKKPPEQWRVFCAPEIPAQIRRRIADHVELLRKQLPNVSASWNREENMHLTLKFLGNLTPERVASLSQTAERAAQSIPSFDLAIEGCDSFPAQRPPRVLWIGIEDPTGNLDRLQRSLEDECAAAGFAREERAFHPHLTIARLRRPQGARRLAELHREIGFEKADFAVHELCVIRSELLPDASRHTVSSRHPLGARPHGLQ